MKVLHTIVLLLLSYTIVYATHERAGEITYKHIEGFTYEVSILTYTYSPSPADRPELEIKWGDGTSEFIPRVDSVNLTSTLRKNIYIGLHTYSAAGTYILSMEDPNRNAGIINIPYSVNIPFYIETTLVINPFLGYNNSVQLLNPPLDQGCVDRLFIHNPGAFDPDGDSISYQLTVCRGQDGQEIPGYTLPEASIDFFMDPVSGNLHWENPLQQGEYNVAFKVIEWREGQLISSVTRDLQVQIGSCNNFPPTIISTADTCITAQDYLSFDVLAEDSDGDYIIITGFGGAFESNTAPANINPDPGTGAGSAATTFEWQTNCSHVRKNPYTTYFKAQDYGTGVNLTSYHTTNIYVNGPPPQNLSATALSNSIILEWEPSICSNSVGYNIYRKRDFYGFVAGYCEIGVPSYTGYELIASIDKSEAAFTDNNGGIGLFHGINYCYMITEIYGDGAESYASEEVCEFLNKDMPIITNVSVNYTSTNQGSVYVAWSKPSDLDFNQYPGPFEYHLYRREESTDSNYEIAKIFYDLNDTIFIDSSFNFNLNTQDYRYHYYIDFYHGEHGDDFTRIGTTPSVPSTYLEIEPSDRKLILSWQDDMPWINDTFCIFRKGPEELIFDSIAYSLSPVYIDSNLINGEKYCYYVKSIGRYSIDGIIDPIINFSQENCSRPVDNVPPCIPELEVETNCDDFTNELLITYPDSCLSEEIIYYIYYASAYNEALSLVDSTIYNSYLINNNNSIVGCFAVTSLDSLRNESDFSEIICVGLETCDIAYFPDFISPNGDAYNELFRAYEINSVESLHIIIFNRWGSLVFESNDPYFTWDGIDQYSKRPVSDGVYYFVATLVENTLRGPVQRVVKSDLTILR